MQSTRLLRLLLRALLTIPTFCLSRSSAQHLQYTIRDSKIDYDLKLENQILITTISRSDQEKAWLQRVGSNTTDRT